LLAGFDMDLVERLTRESWYVEARESAARLRRREAGLIV